MADDRGRGDDNRSDDRSDGTTWAEVPGDLSGDVPGEEQARPDEQGASDDHPDIGDVDRAPASPPSGCP